MAFEPTIVSFLCNWCSYTGADLAGTSRMKYAPNIRVIRVMCSGRIEPTFVLKAFKEGADGVEQTLLPVGYLVTPLFACFVIDNSGGSVIFLD